jgi:isopentenyl phosphate kinase
VITFNGADNCIVKEEFRGKVAWIVKDNAFYVLDVGDFFVFFLTIMEAKWEEFGEDEVVPVFFGDISNHKKVLCHILFY